MCVRARVRIPAIAVAVDDARKLGVLSCSTALQDGQVVTTSQALSSLVHNLHKHISMSAITKQ